MSTKPAVANEMKKMSSFFVNSFSLLMKSVLLLLLFGLNNYALSGDGTPATGATALPDLFTGTMSYSIPIEVPAGRNGMQPNLALTYRSGNDSGWIGVGWELEVGSIERSTKFGINYSGDNYVLRISGAAMKLMNIGNDEYRAEVEGDFYRIRKVPAVNGPFAWEVTDKSGTRYLFGESYENRQDDPNNQERVFKWCLSLVQDTNGNYMTYSYIKDQGEIYLDQVNYAGHDLHTPTNYVKFYRESRTDAPKMNTTNFDVKTAYRLKSIDVVATVASNPSRVRAYNLVYDTDSSTTGDQYSISTGRSILTSVQQFGKDSTLDASGTITGGTALPALKLTTPADTNSFAENTWTTTASNWGPANLTWTGDFDGDGKTDIATAKATLNSPVWVKRSTGSSFVEEVWLSTATNYYISWYRTWVGDVNGDGKSDIISFHVVGPLWGAYTTFVKVLRSTGTSFVEEEWWRLQWSGNEATDYIWAGDFNGDGKTDIAKASGGTIWVWGSAGSAFVKETWTTTASNWGPANLTWTGDFDGDGKTDIATAKAT